MEKFCPKCKIQKDVSAFSKDRAQSNGLSSYCKPCETIQKREYRRKYRDRVNSSPYGVYSKLQQRSKRKELPICSRAAFVAWFQNQSLECHYCGCSLREQRRDRSTRFEIDRKNCKKGYILSNIVLACSRCNVAKFDYWDYNTFKKYIAPAIRAARQA